MSSAGKAGCSHGGGTPSARTASGSDRPMEQGKGIGLVVVHRAVAQLADSGDHRLLARVALASDVALDCAHWHPLIGNPVVLAERAELAQKTAISMGGIDAGMTPDLQMRPLESNKAQPVRVPRSSASRAGRPGVAAGVQGAGSDSSSRAAELFIRRRAA